MLALIASPNFKSAFPLEFHREKRASETDKVARLITNLHGVLVNPDAAPGAQAAAGRMLLRVLERTREMRFSMVPPLAKSGGPRREEALAESLPAGREACDGPVSFPTPARRARAISPVTCTSTSKSRHSHPHEHAEIL